MYNIVHFKYNFNENYDKIKFNLGYVIYKSKIYNIYYVNVFYVLNIYCNNDKTKSCALILTI